ncbi:MAG: hypothetical protein K4H23_05305 [Mollicutes bacterium PWAP]|nr:hypothetical protein [Mollicutes bacterium PWAP]
MKGSKIKIKISSIELSKVNPRFTTIHSTDVNLIDVIKSGNDNYVEENVIKELLQREGDFKNFVDLLSSISLMGFDTKIESLYVVKKEEKIIVAEGNRRILALKLLNGLVQLPVLDDIMSHTDYDENVTSDDYNLPTALIKRTRSNYKKIEEIIKDFPEDKKKEKIEVKVVQENTVLWKMIYAKHVVGERPGMRKWPRGKYFVDILHFFPNGFDSEEDDDINKVLIKQIQRSVSSVKSDYKHAQFVRDVFWSKYNFNPECILKVYSKMKKNPISALQSNFSVRGIYNTASKELYYKKELFESMFKITFNDKNIIQYEGKLDKMDVLKFILKWYNAGVITTRPIPAKAKNNFAKGVRNLLMISSVDKLTKNEPIKNIFSYSPDDLEIIIDQTDDTEDKKMYTFVKKVSENNTKLAGMDVITIDNTTGEVYPSHVFVIIEKQIKHNIDTPIPFLNAIGSSLRSLLEQIYAWGAYFDERDDGALNNLYDGPEDIESKKHIHVERMAKRKKGMNDIFSGIRNKKDETLTKKIIRSITSLDEFEALKIAKFLVSNNSKIGTVLNEAIHASHRIYSKKDYILFLEDFSNFQENILTIVENINLEKINNLSEIIYKKIN